jgi:hypothetical protein
MRAAVWLLLLANCGRWGFATTDAGDVPVDVPASPDSLEDGPNRVFVTSTLYLASSLASLTQADAICAERAAAAGLPGQYAAWLSLEGIHARDRLAGARGWVRPDGAAVADRVEDLIARGPIFPLMIDELGNDIGTANPRALTGTSDDGNANSDSCATTSMIRGGRTWRTYSAWTSHASQGCELEGPLYCFGIDRNVELAHVPSAGRLAFVSTSQFDPGSTLEAADQRCVDEAAAVGLVGSFRALLGTSTMAAAARFDATGPTWVRLDGVALAASADAVLRGELSTSLNVTAAGNHVTVLVATGGAQPTNVGITTCEDWTASSGTYRVGDANAAGSRAFDARTGNCGTPVAVYCLAQ